MSTRFPAIVNSSIGYASSPFSTTNPRAPRLYVPVTDSVANPIVSVMKTPFAALDAVASDLVFDQGICSPTFRIAEMTISGA
jgi:hypothetical protein